MTVHGDEPILGAKAEPLAALVAGGNRRGLAKAITLFESKRAEDRDAARALLAQLMPKSGQSLRLGISGAPGVGKSTFIEAFGQALLASGHRLAILAIDPSSPISGGSIMGDRTRMESLSRDPRVFIRPSPAGQELGGVARRTREAMIACEAAGHDVIIVETVGVGQSEHQAAAMVDAFIVLHLPNSGDELQGIKRGILELADLLVITKADGELVTAAKLARAQLEHALHVARRRDGSSWRPPVLLTSAREGTGLDDVCRELAAFLAAQKAAGAFAQRRADQATRWFHDELLAQLRDSLEQDPSWRAMLVDLDQKVAHQSLPASVAAQRLVQRILTPASSPCPSCQKAGSPGTLAEPCKTPHES